MREFAGRFAKTDAQTAFEEDLELRDRY